MAQFITTGSVNYNNLRLAIRAATSGALNNQTIDIGTGLYDIRSSDTVLTPIPNPDPLALRNPNTFARFGAKTLTFSGSGSSNDPTISTIITGNARIYTNQSDRSSGVPVGITINRLRLSYGEVFTGYTSPNGSGYILQSGVKQYGAGGLTGITSRIGTVSLDGVTFAGVHTGAVGNNGGAPYGNYMDVAVGTSLTFNKINVALTGQGGGTYFANNPTGYGSAFLLANGPQITVTNSTFDEAGYRNALSLWGASGFETNVTIFKNTFTRTANQGIRTAGETLSRVKGSVTENTFEQGAYLDLQNLDLPSTFPTDPDPTNGLGIANNTFTLLNGGYGVVVRNGQSVTNLANLVIEFNAFNGGLAVLNQISTPNSVLTFGTNTVNGVAYVALQVGGTGADTITGTSDKEWIAGGGGNDDITTNGGDDAIVFSDFASVDTVRGFSSSCTIQLEDAVFTTPGLLSQANNGLDLDLFYNSNKFATLVGLAGQNVVGTPQIVFF
ncbi:hypothetical protein NZK32_02180 [Cyanobium sp. FGCU-52]|nr:hypothetical protein [Cyanobium sp. FGCU52]